MDINDSTAFGRGSDVVENIFGKLWSQREIYGTLSILQQYLPDDVTIAEKQAELLKWLEQPTLIARKIKSLRLEEPSDYKKKLLDLFIRQ